jgi:ketosteroid isomerase-like protein
MSVNELQNLKQQFADAFDQRDLTPAIKMLSEDVEVFDHVPYRFDGKQLFVKYLKEAGERPFLSNATRSLTIRHAHAVASLVRSCHPVR